MSILVVVAGVTFLIHSAAYVIAWVRWPRPRTRTTSVLLVLLALAGVFASVHSIAAGLFGLPAAFDIARGAAIVFNLAAALFVWRALSLARNLKSFGDQLAAQIEETRRG